MAMLRSPSSGLLLLLFLLTLLFSGYESEKRHVRGAEMAMKSHHRMLEMRSLTPESTCNPPPTERVGSVPLVHRQGPCSPLKEKRLQPYDSTSVFLRDQSRVDSIRGSLASSFSSSDVYHPTTMDLSSPPEPGEGLKMPVQVPSPGAGEYVVTVGLGTPRRDLPLIFDTGSALTWTQCLPCPAQGCCSRPDRCFEPSKSSTYSDPLCKPPGSCTYSITYADNSSSSGYYARDILAFSSDYQFRDFIFGCGQSNSDEFGNYTGILGLADGYASLISQTSKTFAQIFCYCIPPMYSSQGYLLFGFGALEKCQGQTQHYTKILPDPSGSSLYFVKLNGVTIGDRTLDLSKLVLIDSGTTITRLPPFTYSALRDEFMKQMSKYPVAPVLPPLLDTCYNLEGHEGVVLPTMVLNFDGTDVNVDPTGVVWRESDSQVCLAFAANEKEDDLTIIGSTQQRKLDILYDIQEKKVEFGTGSCGN